MLQNNSYQDMITKLMLTGISEQQYNMLANGPLTDNKSRGISKVASELIQEQSSCMADRGPVIWDEIAKIKTYVQKRNSIDEKKMYTEEESHKLLKTTEDVQKILEHIAHQEEKFIELSDIVNKNIFNIFNQYVKKAKTCEEIAKSITEKLAHQHDPILSSTTVAENDIYLATSLDMIDGVVQDNKINENMGVDILEYARQNIDVDSYDGFILLQVWIALCFRFNIFRMNKLENRDFDAFSTMQMVLAEKEDAAKVLDTNALEQEFKIEDKDKLVSLRDDLHKNLNINTEYTKQVITELDDLIELSSQREPKEVSELQGEDVDG